jgi:hypothetical protein
MAKNGKAAKANGNGRTKKPPKEPKKTAEALSEEQRQVLFFQHKRKIKPLVTALQNAQAALTKAYELAKKEGVLKKDLQLALKMETEEGAASVKGEIDRALQVARWMGAELGTQFELGMPGVDPIFEEGKRAAMDERPRKPPDHLGQRAAQRWLTGYDDGIVAVNKTRAEGFRPLGEVITDIVPPSLAGTGNAQEAAAGA